MTNPMAHLRNRFAVALLAFGVGISVHVVRVRLDRWLEQKPVIESVRLPSDTFEGTGIIDMFMEFYQRPSDGASARYGCSDRSSATAALRLLRNTGSPLVEKTNVLNKVGVKIGERVVWNSGESLYGAGVEWNEGSRLFYIHATSLLDALTFEKSKVWRGAGCWDFRSL